MAQTTFDFVSTPNWHRERQKAILRKYPEVRKLAGPNSSTKYFMLAIVLMQLALCFAFRELPVWMMVVCAYFIGGFANHALLVLIHECSHNLAAKTPTANKLLAVLSDCVIAIPVAMGFCKYHTYHHLHLGEYNYDPDIVSYREGKLVGNSKTRKFLWLCFLSLSQAFRPLKVKDYTLFDRWTLADLALVVVFDVLIAHFLGYQAFFYLLLSSLFGLGLHPVGGRWIAEHYVTTPGQETYSYYGPLNKLAFNMGYHNEHHDFLGVPWNKLPQLRRIAPDYYDNIPFHKSWSAVLWRFIMDPNMNCFSRIVHPDRPPDTEPFSPG
jgi:sphingolipid delta-4 desaturase